MLHLKYDEPLSNFAFKFNLRCYSVVRLHDMWADSRIVAGDLIRLVAPAGRPGPPVALVGWCRLSG